ncbi:MAG TPA: hypothetical protein VHB72_01245 [Candidatus Saccharimonadales bacterium]|nr:hypothetical protein [Candidatus Saccharimonadales bacterium]
MTKPAAAPKLELWAQYHTVGPYGYADSDGDPINRPTPEAAEALLNHRDKLRDICWVNFSLFAGDGDEEPAFKVGESIIAVRQQRIYSVRFRPVSEVIDSGEIPPHTAKWLGYLASGDRTAGRSYDEPDQFEDLLALAQQTGALERN